MNEPAPLELMEYRENWIIERAPLHVPHMWQWRHRDYDGAPERVGEGPADCRCGYGDSLQDCYDQIHDLENEQRGQ